MEEELKDDGGGANGRILVVCVCRVGGLSFCVCGKG